MLLKRKDTVIVNIGYNNSEVISIYKKLSDKETGELKLKLWTTLALENNTE